MAFHYHKSREFVLLASQAFSDWKNAMGKSRGTFHRHEQSQRHNKSIEETLYSVFKKRVEKNKKILLSILDVILRLGRINIPLRSSHDINIQYFVE